MKSINNIGIFVNLRVIIPNLLILHTYIYAYSNILPYVIYFENKQICI